MKAGESGHTCPILQFVCQLEDGFAIRSPQAQATTHRPGIKASLATVNPARDHPRCQAAAGRVAVTPGRPCGLIRA